jgi:hypothetical protein
MALSLDTTFWHDGQLHGIAFVVGAGGAASVRLSLSLYDDDQAPQRKQVVVLCTEVSRFSASVDVAELKDNARAGNIGDGRIEDGLLVLGLTGGTIEVAAKEFRADAV